MVDELESVAVCVCTYRRTDDLRRLLERLTIVAERASHVARMAVAVADDDPDRSAQPVLDDFDERFELGLHRTNTGSGNISIARNAVVALVSPRVRWIAMIDDDCLPDPDWLVELLSVQQRTGADCVSGRCADTPPTDAPGWLIEEPFLDGPTAGSDGAPIEIGALKNTMVSAAFLRSSGVRFDEDWGRTGGEDVLFFNACSAAGAVHVFGARAVVSEEVPVERTSLRYQLRRRLWYGNTEALTSITTGRSSRRRMVARGCKVALAGAASPIADVIHGRRVRWRYPLAEILRGVGRLLGSVGVRLDHH